MSSPLFLESSLRQWTDNVFPQKKGSYGTRKLKLNPAKIVVFIKVFAFETCLFSFKKNDEVFEEGIIYGYKNKCPN